MSLPESFQNNFLPEEIQFLIENELITVIPYMDGKKSTKKPTAQDKRRLKLLQLKKREREERKTAVYSDDEDEDFVENKEKLARINKNVNSTYLDSPEHEEMEDEEASEFDNFDWSFITTDHNVLRQIKSLIPIEIPLWMAMILKKQRFCRLVPPTWFRERKLKEFLMFEKKNPYKFSSLPWNWMIITKLFLNKFQEDLDSESNIDTIRGLLQDIREIRMAKVQKGIEILNESHLQLDNLSLLEINEFRPFIITTMNKMKNLHKSSLTEEDLREAEIEYEKSKNNPIQSNHYDNDNIPINDYDMDDYNI